ncbi:MAG: hypothetical protein CMH30_03820 [Micavibrio sp.]|nr:hypothetical protein [Micavibrio sp.]|tara:strand:+ start:1271 stop:2236 length:966 start_codon:yes stop_codon:yes gene_type:complete
MQIKRIAILGLGSIGMRHFSNVVELGLEPLGYDPSEERRRVALNKIPQANVFDSIEDAINAADAVIIASPHKYHLEALKQCVAAGKPCLVEKPIATQVEGLHDILQDAQAKNLVVACGFNLRFRPVVEKARDALPSLGKILWARFICATYLPDWRPDQDYKQNYTADPQSGGVIFDVAHEIDLACYLLGSAKIVAASAENSGLLEIASEDIAELTLKYEKGGLSQIHLDYVTKPRQRGFEIAGENGVLRVDMVTHKIQMQDCDGSVLLDELCPPEFNNYEYLEELKDFIAAVENSSAPRCSGQEGLENLTLILEARKKAGL